MKRYHKITLASLGTAVGIFAGILTVVEKSVALIAKASPQREKREYDNVNPYKDMGVKYSEVTNHDTDRKTGMAAK